MIAVLKLFRASEHSFFDENCASKLCTGDDVTTMQTKIIAKSSRPSSKKQIG